VRTSRVLAGFLGVLAPLLESIRRWGNWWSDPAAYLDDWLLGLCLIAGAWAAGRGERGRRFLAAAWGLACGMGYYSCVGQWQHWRAGAADPAPISSGAVLLIKCAGLAVAAWALVLTVRARAAYPKRTL
jgi:hypothetical protein